MGFTFDGVSALTKFDKVISITRSTSAPVSLNTLKIEGKAGAYFYGKEVDAYTIECRCFLKGEGTTQEEKYQNLWSRIRDINAWLLTDKPKKLILDDEPDLYYYAIVHDKIDLEEILELGFVTVRFYVPDAYAYGETKTQRVSSAGLTFQRNGIRYRNDGSEVTENYPVYQPGKIDQAIQVMEGTTNLLPSAASPVQEELTVTPGTDYYLTCISGSSKIEHKKVEDLTDITLDKEGTDVNQTFDTSPEFNGTKTNVIWNTANSWLEVSRVGTDLDVEQSTQADFQTGQVSGVTVKPDGRVLLNNPTWESYDDMSNWDLNWDILSTQTASGVTQQPTSVLISANASAPNSTGIRKNGFGFPTTFAFRAKVSGYARVSINDGSYYINTELPNSANWAWYYVVFKDRNNVTVYKDGVLQSTVVRTGTVTQNYAAFYVPIGQAGTLELDQVYYDIGWESPAPPTNGVYSGSYISRAFDLRGVGNVSSNYITDFKGNTSIGGTISLEYQLGTYNPDQSITWDTSWTPHTGLSISILPPGTNVSNKAFRYRYLYSTTDPGAEIYVNYVAFSITSNYYPNGTYISNAIDLSGVGKAMNTSISYDATPNAGTVSVSVAYSDDSYSTWYSVSNGSSLPNITQTTNLVGKSMKYKIVMTTANNETPFVESVSINLTSGYKTSKTVNLSPVNVGSIGIVSDSYIQYAYSAPTNTSVSVEYSIDGGTTWNPTTTENSFIPTGTDLTGKTLNIRYTLATSDNSIRPSINSSITWKIAQQEPNYIKPATNKLILTPTNVSRWQLEQKSYGTDWQAYGVIRNPEILSVYAGILTDDESGGQTSDGALELWAYVESQGIEKYLIASDASVNEFYLKQLANGNFELLFYNQTWNDISPLPDGWHHFVLTWNGTHMDLYIDGVVVKSHDYATDISLGDIEQLYLGCSASGTKQWNNLIDEVILHQNAVDQAYVSSRYNNPQPAPVTLDTAIFHLDGTLQSEGDTNITVEGTAPTYPVITVRFVQQTNTISVGNGIDTIQLNRQFNVDDELVIDCSKNVCTLNGSQSLAMPYLTLDSDFFSVKTGQQIEVVPVGVAIVDVSFTERYL